MRTQEEQEQEQRQNLQHVVVWVALQVCCCDTVRDALCQIN